MICKYWRLSSAVQMTYDRRHEQLYVGFGDGQLLSVEMRCWWNGGDGDGDNLADAAERRRTNQHHIHEDLIACPVGELLNSVSVAGLRAINWRFGCNNCTKFYRL